MKNRIILIIPICIALFAATTGCMANEDEVPQQPSSNVNKPEKVNPVPTKKNTNTPVSKKSKIKPQESNFAGTYSVTLQGTTMSVTLFASNDKVTGTFLMNGQQAKINGTVKNLICTGQIVEDDTQKAYRFEATRKDEYLNFSFVVPEQNNQVVKLLMKKENATQSGSKVVNATTNHRNQLLIGTWRYTEVISSGSGQFYSSFATDYFVKFNQNGSAQIWTGKSAGGTNGVTIDGAKPGTLQQAEWYTEGKLLYFVDPSTKAKSSISYYAEPNRMMLTKGNSKKVYQKIN